MPVREDGELTSAVEAGAYRSDLDKNMLGRLTEDGRADMTRSGYRRRIRRCFRRLTKSAIAIAQALSEPHPKRRYLAIPRNAKDGMNSRSPERLIRWQVKQLV